MIKLKQVFSIICENTGITLLFYLLLGLNYAYSQDTPASSPSISSFENHSNAPAGLCTGIPDITQSLLKLPTKSKNVTFDFNIRYHPNNIPNHVKATDVGLGWSLFGLGGISKSIVSGADEHYNQTGIFGSYDDIYNYNFLGISGKFKFNKVNGQYYINKLTSSVLKISFTNTSSNGLFVNSLTIIDGNGIKYVFDQVDFVIDKQRVSGTNTFRNATSNTFFHLTKIYDDLGNEIANINYETIYNGSFENFKKVKSITALHMGKLEFDYVASGGFPTRNDVGQLNAVRLKNTSGEIIRSCKLGYVFSSHQWPDNVRFLTSLNLCDSNESPIEKYEFSYAPSNSSLNILDEYNYTSQYPTNGVLQKVKLPTGGHIIYNFESNRVNVREYQDGEIYFGSGTGGDLFLDENTFFDQNTTQFTTPNNPAAIYWQEKGGLRIGSILQFDSQGQSMPSKSVYYDYNDFNEPNNSSGQMMIEKYLPNEKLQVKVFYKNVKVTEGTGNGYTRYSFYTYRDTERWEQQGTYPYYESFMVVKDGLLKNKEIYSNDNKLLQQNKYYYSAYTDQLLGINLYFPADNGVNFFAPYTIISGTYIISKNYSYNPDKIITEKNITLIDPFTRRTSNMVNYDSNNNRNITNFYYSTSFPNEPNVGILISKNRRYDLLKTESFFESNKLSEEKPVYKDWGNGMIAPEFMQESKSTGTLETREKYTKVDNQNGNLLEIEHENGMKTSYVYGYNKTQKVVAIDNIAYDNIPANLITSIQNASDAIPYNEQNLLNALNALRTHSSLSNSMVTTYTYKSLVGVSSVTDAKGDKISYDYDTFGRLKAVRNKDGNILSEKEYRYRTQN